MESRVPSSVALVSQTMPSATTGDDQALPSIGTFQTTFSVSLQATGSDVARARPFPAGPRN